MTQSLQTPRRAIFRRIATASTAVLLAIGLGGCNYRFGIPEPATEQGKEVLTLWQVSLYAAVALGVIVLGILFYSLIRHRRRNNDLPVQTEGNVALEITYTIIPFLIVAALFVYGIKVQNDATELTSSSDAAAAEMLNVDVTGYQWNWRFHYPAEDLTLEPDSSGQFNEMVLPVGHRVRFNLVAVDVNHSFFVPGFLTKRDLIPGVRNEIEVTPQRTGTFLGYCAEYCGLYHSQMNFNVKIVPQAEYDSWVQTKKAELAAVQAQNAANPVNTGRPANETPVEPGKVQVAQ